MERYNMANRQLKPRRIKSREVEITIDGKTHIVPKEVAHYIDGLYQEAWSIYSRVKKHDLIGPWTREQPTIQKR